MEASCLSLSLSLFALRIIGNFYNSQRDTIGTSVLLQQRDVGVMKIRLPLDYKMAEIGRMCDKNLKS